VRDSELRGVRQLAHQRFAAERASLRVDGKAVQPFTIGIVGTDPGVLRLGVKWFNSFRHVRGYKLNN
jgi:hypothetical protein